MKFLTEYIPSSLKKRIKKYYRQKEKNRILSLPPIDEERFRNIIVNVLGIENSELVFIHSSLDQLNITFKSYDFFKIIFSISPDATIVFPTYPGITSYKYLKSGNVFNIKKTPTHTGLLNEFARRHKNARRSLHPTKSVVAIGPLSEELTAEHHLSPYPYDKGSPYYKAIENNALIIGLGVKTTYLSAVHSVDDYLKEEFPVNPYHDELFQAKCIDYDKKERIVPTFAHDMRKMNFDLPAFFQQNFDDNIVRDINIEGMNFFRAQAKPMFEQMVGLAREGITIYKKKHYKREWK